MDFKVEKFDKHTDARGDLVVFLRNSDINKPDKEFGQIYFITFAKKGTIRGNHYHKYWREWFGVVYGKLEVYLEDIKTGKKKKLIIESDTKHYLRLEIGPYIVHTFKSISPKAAVINYANREWGPHDTFFKIIVK